MGSSYCYKPKHTIWGVSVIDGVENGIPAGNNLVSC